MNVNMSSAEVNSMLANRLVNVSMCLYDIICFHLKTEPSLMELSYQVQLFSRLCAKLG